MLEDLAVIWIILLSVSHPVPTPIVPLVGSGFIDLNSRLQRHHSIKRETHICASLERRNPVDDRAVPDAGHAA